MFIGRRPDGTIYGAWTMPQVNDADHPNVEEVADDHSDLVAFRSREMPRASLTIDALATALIAKGALNETDIANAMDTKEPK